MSQYNAKVMLRCGTSEEWKLHSKVVLLKAEPAIEYEADDKKYVHLYEIIDGKPKSLWIEVEPVEWIVDEKTNLGISRRVLFGGLALKDKDGNELLKPFIEETFNNEIKQSEINKQLTIKL